MERSDVNDESVVLVDSYRAAATAASNSNSYRGLRIHALPGLHAFLADVCQTHLPQKCAVLDLAAGSGALSLRLNDLGFLTHAADYVPENFNAPDIPFTKANLNENFCEQFQSSQFGGVVASEIVEHLENPRHFIRQCRRLLGEHGVLVLSTPNLLNSGSIASFIRSGNFLWFSDNDYRTQGHITPVSPWQIQRCLSEAGFRMLWSGSFGVGATRLEGSPRLSMLSRVIDWVSGVPKDLRGEVYVCVAMKM